MTDAAPVPASAALRRRRRSSWRFFGTASLATVVLIALLVVLVDRRDAALPNARDCPSSRVVAAAVEAPVAAPTVASSVSVLGCFYGIGSDTEAVVVTFDEASVASSTGPCAARRRLLVAGHAACSVPQGPPRSAGAALVVEVGGVEEEVSTDRATIPPGRVEALAATVADAPPPPLQRQSPR